MAQFKMIDSEDGKSQQFDTSKPVYAYIRFSTMGQVKNSKENKVQEDTRMHEKLISHKFGWLPANIKKMDKDEGMSAQKGTDKRLDLAEIYRAMKAGQCGGIAAFDASRLWRDRDRVYFDDFIVRIKKYNVPVILYSKTYWPKIKSDMEALRAEFEYAQKALEQFYDKANPARQEAVLSGSFGGHATPIGFVISGEKGNRHYVVYEPHAKLIRWLFKRYQQLNGNLGRLGRELGAAGFHFPDFDKDELIKLEADLPHVALKRDAKGYKFQARGGLISVLTNRAYIGWYVFNAKSEESKVFQGEYINKYDIIPTAIVELEGFLYAYSRLSKTTLDGEPNEKKPAVNRHYSRVDALLEGLLTSDGAPCWALSEGCYVAKKNDDGWNHNSFKVSIAEIDQAFSEALTAALAAMELSEDQQQQFADKVSALKAEQEEKASDLTNQLANIDKAIRQWGVAKRAAMEAEYQPDVTEAMRNLKRLHAEREAVEQQANKAAKEAGLLAECTTLIDCAIRDWKAMKFEKQQRLVHLLVGCANIEAVSPHIIELTVALVEPLNVVLQCYAWRKHSSRPKWQDSENAVLRKLYACADRAIILEALPTRCWDSIVMQATKVLNLKRETGHNTSSITNESPYADEQAIKKLGSRQWPVWTVDNNIEYVSNLMKTSCDPLSCDPDLLWLPGARRSRR